MTERLRPYEGHGPFTFVSYAHKDRGAAEAIMSNLNNNGVNLWFDLGIAPGTLWRDELAQKILACDTFLFFQSAQSVRSENCQNEIAFALEKKKKIIVVRLDRTELPGGLSLAIGDRQAIEKFNLAGDFFYEVLLKALIGGSNISKTDLNGRDFSFLGHSISKKIAAGGAGLLATILVVVGGFLFWPNGSAPLNPAQQELSIPRVGEEAHWKSLAVLPLINMSGDPGKEILVDGLTEELINVLAQNTDLRIAASTSTFVLKDAKLDAKTVGQALNVEGLLEGSVRWSDTRVRVDAKLIDAKTGFQIWADSFERNDDDYFKIQQEIAFAVASEITSRRANASQYFSETVDFSAAAWDKFISAQHLLQSGEFEDLVLADELFGQVIEAEPQFSGGYAWKAYTVQMAGGKFDASVADKVHSLAKKALELNPNSAEAYASLGDLYNHLRDFEKAQSYFERALEINPYSMHALNSSAWGYEYRGFMKLALEKTKRAYDIDPLNQRVMSRLITLLSHMERFDESEKILGRHMLVATSPEAKSWNRQRRFFMYWDLALLDPMMEIYDELKREDPDSTDLAFIKSDLKWSLNQIECDPIEIVGPAEVIRCRARLGQAVEAHHLLSRYESRLTKRQNSLLRGTIAAMEGNFVVARAAFEELPAETFNSEAIYLIGEANWYIWTLRETGDFEKANEVDERRKIIVERLKSSDISPIYYLQDEVEALAIKGQNDAAINLLESHFDQIKYYPHYRNGILLVLLGSDPRYQALTARIEADLEAKYKEIEPLL